MPMGRAQSTRSLRHQYRLSSDPGTAALRPVLHRIGDGINYAGRVIEDPKLSSPIPDPVGSAIRDASTVAFIDGMDRAFIISGIAIILGSFLSLALIRDRVAEDG